MTPCRSNDVGHGPRAFVVVFALPQGESGTISLLTPSSVQASDAVITQCLAWVRHRSRLCSSPSPSDSSAPVSEFVSGLGAYTLIRGGEHDQSASEIRGGEDGVSIGGI